MTRPELELAVDWAAEEGWNPGLNDAECFFTADPEGFLVGTLDGEPVSVISAVRYGRTFGFVGFYIVKPAYRGRGLGIRIWNAAMERLEGRTIGLDGVVDQQSNYSRSGFVYAHRNVRYRGVVPSATAARDERVVALGEVPFDDLAVYDRPFFPDDRTRFLRSWTTQPGATALGVLEGGRIRGYGVFRPCRSGGKIGPLFADAPDMAQALFDGLCAGAEPGAPVYLDVPEVNASAVRLAQGCGMTVVFETARMYTGEAPDLALDRLYGVTTFELG